MIYLQASFWKRKKRNTKEHQVQSIEGRRYKLTAAQTTFFAKPFDENKMQGNLDAIVLVGLTLRFFPLMISLRKTWARCELVACQQKRDSASLVFRMLKYYEKVNVSKEIHQGTVRQARNKLYAKFRKTHTKKFFKT